MMTPIGVPTDTGQRIGRVANNKRYTNENRNAACPHQSSPGPRPDRMSGALRGNGWIEWRVFVLLTPPLRRGAGRHVAPGCAPTLVG